MSVQLCGLRLEHPVVNGSGTFDAIAALTVFGGQLLERFPFAAYVSKTITLRPRGGNPPPRLWEAPAGLVNSIGLPNRGLAGYLEHDLPILARLSVPLITNVMGSTAQELVQLVSACERRGEISAIELNVSCPNVETGLDIGSDPYQLEAVCAQTRRATRKPLIVKLTPNTADVAACAAAAEAGGADAVSLINTLRAMAISPATRQPSLGGGTGGLSGPAVRAVALAQVAAVARRVDVPVIGMGGVQTANHARDLLDAGATLVAVGSESFRDPLAAARIAASLAESKTNTTVSKRSPSTNLDTPEPPVEP
ncbi:MAG: dihydroorotate dehydrogenase [Solirubrobacteraceae bacterium]